MSKRNLKSPNVLASFIDYHNAMEYDSVDVCLLSDDVMLVPG